MVVGITGPMGFVPQRMLNMINSLIRVNSYVYLNIEATIGNLLKKDSNCYKQVIEKMGDRLDKYKEINAKNFKKGSFDLKRIYKTGIIYKYPEDYRVFMDTVQPYVSACIARNIMNNPDEVIFVSANHLFDYDWAEKCDRIVYVDASRYAKSSGWMQYHITRHEARAIDEQFMPLEEQKKKSDFVISKTKDTEGFENEVKWMVIELLKFNNFVKATNMPLPSDEVRKKDQDRLKEVDAERKEIAEKEGKEVPEKIKTTNDMVTKFPEKYAFSIKVKNKPVKKEKKKVEKKPIAKQEPKKKKAPAKPKKKNIVMNTPTNGTNPNYKGKHFDPNFKGKPNPNKQVNGANANSKCIVVNKANSGDAAKKKSIVMNTPGNGQTPKKHIVMNTPNNGQQPKKRIVINTPNNGTQPHKKNVVVNKKPTDTKPKP
jgi:dephospho-CoA kinase